MTTAHTLHVTRAIRVDDIAFAICLSTVAVAPIVLSASAHVEKSALADPTAYAPAESPPVGTFARTDADGTPVYRLPPIRVMARGGVEFARIGHDGERARADATPAGHAPPPTAAILAVPAGG